MKYPSSFLDEIRARVPITQVVGRSVQWDRRKSQSSRGDYWACCPFHNEKTPSFHADERRGRYHCLAGETLVQTWDGEMPIADLAGKTVRVLDGNGDWVDASFRSLGHQRVYRIDLSRNGLKKSIRVTAEHRWFRMGRNSAVTTNGLRSGDRLKSVVGRPLDLKPDIEGIRHGFVFGDGTAPKGRGRTIAYFCGAKQEFMLPLFEGRRLVYEDRITICGLPGYWKSLPADDSSPDYLAGFLAGLLAADGHVDEHGTVILNQASREVLEAVRTMAARIGIATYGITTQSRIGIGQSEPSDIHRVNFVGGTVPAFMLLNPIARDRMAVADIQFGRTRWVVQNVVDLRVSDEVYCTEVESTGSFVLADSLLTGNCFGCGADGDHFTFLTETAGMTFSESVAELAKEAGLEVPHATEADRVKEQHKLSLLEITEKAATIFQQRLRSEVGKDALAYLHSRGLTDDVIDRFRIGFSPEARTDIKTSMMKSGATADDLIATGLIVSGEGIPVSFDRFHGRVIFPIADDRGRIVAFGGRALNQDARAKYINSPETDLFVKGRMLYNFRSAREATRKGHTPVLVEGYMDVVTAASSGFSAAVAPMGTSVTEEQLVTLWRLHSNPVACFDGDEAGLRAAYRMAELALPTLAPAKSIRFAIMPTGIDPDKLIRVSGRAAFGGILKKAMSLSDVLWHKYTDAKKFRTPEEVAGLRSAIHEITATIKDDEVRRAYRSDMRDRLYHLGRRPRIVRSNGHSHHSASPAAGRLAQGFQAPSITMRDATLIAAMIVAPSQALSFGEELAMVTLTAETRAAVDVIIAAVVAQNDVKSDDLLDIVSASDAAMTIDKALAMCQEAGLTNLQPGADAIVAATILGTINASDSVRR